MTEDEFAEGLESILFDGASTQVCIAKFFIDLNLGRYCPTTAIRGGKLVDATPASERSPITQPHTKVMPLYEHYLEASATVDSDVSMAEFVFSRSACTAHFSWEWRVLRLGELLQIKDAVDPQLARLRREVRSRAPSSKFATVEFSQSPAGESNVLLTVNDGSTSHIPPTNSLGNIVTGIRLSYLNRDRWLYATRLHFHVDPAEDDHWSGLNLLSTGFFGQDESAALIDEASRSQPSFQGQNTTDTI